MDDSNKNASRETLLPYVRLDSYSLQRESISASCSLEISEKSGSKDFIHEVAALRAWKSYVAAVI